MLNSEKAILAMNDVDDSHLESAREMLGYKVGTVVSHPIKKRIITFALAAALILGLSAVAYAIGVHTGFFSAVFGTGLKGRDSFDVVITDDDGNAVKTEHYPAIERVDVDEELAESLTGEYISSVGQSAVAGNYTFALQDAVLDKNGIGAFTVHVSNPNGHGLVQTGNYGPGGHQPFSWFLFPEGDDFHFMDERDYIVPESFSETEADIVFYFTPFTPLPANTGLTIRFSVFTEGIDFPKWPKAEMTIPAQEAIPCRELVGDGITASISPVGLMLHEETPELVNSISDSILIVFSDGSEYTLMATDVVNFSVASVSPDHQTSYYSFNRLCDVDNVVEIRWTATVDSGSRSVSRTLR